MILEKIANRNVVTIPENATMELAAKTMRDQHVGCVVVVEDKGLRKIPIGIITDRDIVVSTSAFGIAPSTVYVRDVMSSAVVTARKNDSFNHVLMLMKEHGVKRIPIVDSEGALMGIVTNHELMTVLSDELNVLLKVTDRQHQVEADRRPRLG
ncbi:MAG: CBS domain-containing protein [Bdellovibrionales bacterium]|nr:CBS domain-containing protein [Bdellovibrionales bacterium]